MCWIETVRWKRQMPLRKITKRGAVSAALMPGGGHVVCRHADEPVSLHYSGGQLLKKRTDLDNPAPEFTVRY